eukprot:Hpha_TRINITY_DN10247_c0_g1::TRINITY_DN10247_c0_g1_i1::g.35169::m.35169
MPMEELSSPLRAPAELGLHATFEDFGDLCQWESRLRWRVEEEEGIMLSLAITNGTIREVQSQSRRRRGDIVDRAYRLSAKGNAYVGSGQFVHLNEWLTRDIIREHINSYFIREEKENRKKLAIEEIKQRHILLQYRIAAQEELVQRAKQEKRDNDRAYVNRVRQKLQLAVRGIGAFRGMLRRGLPKKRKEELSLMQLERRREKLDELVRGRYGECRLRRLINELQEEETEGRGELLVEEVGVREAVHIDMLTHTEELEVAAASALRRREALLKAEHARKQRDFIRGRERGEAPEREDVDSLKRQLKALLQRGEAHKHYVEGGEGPDGTPPRLKGACAGLRVLAEVSGHGSEELLAVVENCTLRPA